MGGSDQQPGHERRIRCQTRHQNRAGTAAGLNELGLPTATEWLNPITSDYIADLVSYGAIGARTVESPIHRQLASPLPMPVGMKNGTSGSLQVAVDAVTASAAAHTFLGQSRNSSVGLIRSAGNQQAHVILRGSADGPNTVPHLCTA